MKLSKKDRQFLARVLREVERDWGGGQYFPCGICDAVNSKIDKKSTRGYLLMEVALREAQDNFIFELAPYSDEWGEWEPRAFMCLLLTEWLEDSVEELA